MHFCKKGVEVTPTYMKMMKPNDEKIWGWWYQYKPTTLVVNYGWWAIWTTGYDLLSMHKTHVINLVTVQTRVPSRHELVMG